MAKVEVQVRSCFCCGLSLGSIFIALYTLLLYLLLIGLAVWAISDTAANGDSSYYTSCKLEAEGKIRADNRKLTFTGGQTTVIVEDSTSYHCSFGLYTEELKYSQSYRYSVLFFNIVLYSLIVVASVLLLIGLAVYSQWLLLPWILLMLVDIVRGTISAIMIFFYSHTLAMVATGIFFLGLQILHVSMVIIMIAKFQRIHNRKKGIIVDGQGYGAAYYPSATLPSNSNYAYSPSQAHRVVGPPPINRPATVVDYPYSDYSPSQKDYHHHHQYGPPPTPRGAYYDGDSARY